MVDDVIVRNFRASHCGLAAVWSCVTDNNEIFSNA